MYPGFVVERARGAHNTLSGHFCSDAYVSMRSLNTRCRSLAAYVRMADMANSVTTTMISQKATNLTGVTRISYFLYTYYYLFFTFRYMGEAIAEPFDPFLVVIGQLSRLHHSI